MSEDNKMSEDLLKKAVKNKNIGSLYLFYGDEEYLKRNYTGYVEDNLLTGDFKLLNKVVLEGRVSPSNIIDNCETMPVFSDRRMVIVKNSGLFKGKKKADETGKAEKAEKAEKAGKAGTTTKAGKVMKAGKAWKDGNAEDELAEFLQNVPGHVCLIFIENEIDKRIKYVDLIKKNGLIVELNSRKPEELVNWVIKRMRDGKHEIDPNTATQLIEYCEPGMDDISNEIDKLCSYTGDRQKITVADIERVCTKSVKSRIFDLTDAIAEKKCARALSLLNDMILLKEPLQKIMFMIARQFRQLLQIKMLIEEGAAQAEITSRLGLHPYFSGKVIKQARMFSLEKLESAISIGMELDLAIKTGRLKDRTAVELMITSMSA